MGRWRLLHSFTLFCLWSRWQNKQKYASFWKCFYLSIFCYTCVLSLAIYFATDLKAQKASSDSLEFKVMILQFFDFTLFFRCIKLGNHSPSFCHTTWHWEHHSCNSRHHCAYHTSDHSTTLGPRKDLQFRWGAHLSCLFLWAGKSSIPRYACERPTKPSSQRNKQKPCALTQKTCMTVPKMAQLFSFKYVKIQMGVWKVSCEMLSSFCQIPHTYTWPHRTISLCHMWWHHFFSLVACSKKGHYSVGPNGHEYIRCDGIASYNDAKNLCESNGAHLVTILDDQERIFVERLQV